MTKVPPDWRARHDRLRRAFSLIEILMVVAIISIVYAIAMPRYGAARARYGVERATQRLVVDLEYASTLARTTSREIKVCFEKGHKLDESFYWFEGVADPERPGGDYTVVLRRAPYHVVLLEAPGDIVYRIDGLPHDSRTFMIQSAPGTQRVITVDKDTGVIEVSTP